MKKFFKIGCLSFIGIIVLIVIISVATSGGDGGTETASTADSNSGDTKSSEEKEKPAEEKSAKVGDPLKVGDVVFTVHSKTTANNVGGEFGEDAEGKFLILDVSVKNEGKESITTDASFFKLKSGDTTYEASSSAAVYANENAEFFLAQVNPGIENKGKVVFDVPADAAKSNDLILQVQTGLFGTETGTIKLAK